MLKRLFTLRAADKAACTAGYRLALHSLNVGLTYRAVGREDNIPGIRRTLGKHHIDHLRDHIACPTNHYLVADFQT